MRSGAPSSSSPTRQEKELAQDAEQSETQRRPPRTVVPRWVQLVVLPLAIIAAFLLARAAGKVLLIFIIAALIGLILNPAVEGLQRRVRLPRGLAVLTVYMGFFLALAGIGLLLANPVSNQVQAFAHNVPHLIREGEHALAGLQSTLNKAGLHVKLVGHGKTALQTLKSTVEKSATSLVSTAGSVLSEAAAAIVDVVLVFVLSVYVLLYGKRIGALVRRAMPPGDGTKTDDYPHLVQRAVSRYVGGQLLFSVIMGTTAGLALYIYGVLGIFPDGRTYAIAFGAFLGFMELIPYLGPVLGAVPPVLVAFFTDPITAVWVAVLFIGIQQLEGHVVAPQIFGHTLRINPLIVIFGLLIGAQIWGVIGALVALPILSVLRETVIYLSRHLELEPWRDSAGGGML
ncbi:MAG: AI-2E family transporter [Solirubrobacteraceae bacterium]